MSLSKFSITRLIKFSIISGVFIYIVLLITYLIFSRYREPPYTIKKTVIGHLRTLWSVQIEFRGRHAIFVDFDQLMKEYESSFIGERLIIYYNGIKKDHSEVYRTGYYFGMYLPYDSEDAKKYFGVFAWPAHDNSLKSAFIDHNKKVYITKNKNYLGPNKGPKLEDVYTGEPFKSPINTEKWKATD